jgi:hypothetical protein
MGNRIDIKEFIIRLSVIIFAVIAPFIMLCVEGYKPSISSYWVSNMQPLFIIANATTSFYLINFRSWKISGYLLMGLTAFSVQYYPMTHNVLAILFFIASLIPICRSNHFKFTVWIYIASLILLPISLFWFEVVAIIAICTFHMLSLLKFYDIKSKRLKR